MISTVMRHTEPRSDTTDHQDEDILENSITALLETIVDTTDVPLIELGAPSDGRLNDVLETEVEILESRYVSRYSREHVLTGSDMPDWDLP